MKDALTHKLTVDYYPLPTVDRSKCGLQTLIFSLHWKMLKLHPVHCCKEFSVNTQHLSGNDNFWRGKNQVFNQKITFQYISLQIFFPPKIKLCLHIFPSLYGNRKAKIKIRSFLNTEIRSKSFLFSKSIKKRKTNLNRMKLNEKLERNKSERSFSWKSNNVSIRLCRKKYERCNFVWW